MDYCFFNLKLLSQVLPPSPFLTVTKYDSKGNEATFSTKPLLKKPLYDQNLLEDLKIELAKSNISIDPYEASRPTNSVKIFDKKNWLWPTFLVSNSLLALAWGFGFVTYLTISIGAHPVIAVLVGLRSVFSGYLIGEKTGQWGYRIIINKPAPSLWDAAKQRIFLWHYKNILKNTQHYFLLSKSNADQFVNQVWDKILNDFFNYSDYTKKIHKIFKKNMPRKIFKSHMMMPFETRVRTMFHGVIHGTTPYFLDVQKKLMQFYILKNLYQALKEQENNVSESQRVSKLARKVRYKMFLARWF